MDFLSARMNMVESQVRTNDVTDIDIHAAMRTVARERFCAPARAFAAYADVEPEIAPGRWLMTPRDIAKLLQAARPKAGETALCLAAPYAAAVLADIGLKVVAQEGDGRAFGMIELPLEAYGVKAVHADLAKPAPEPAGAAGYDLIVSEGAVTQVPEAWLAALKIGGRLAVVERSGPVGKARLYVRTEAGASAREVFDATPPMLSEFAAAPSFQF